MNLPTIAREVEKPVAWPEPDTVGLPRLRMFSGRENDQEPDWDQIHGDVQRALAELWRKISAASPSALSRPGRTEAPAFALFSYRVFYVADLDEDDPIVVGVTVEDQGTSYLVEGEVVGEETGLLYFDESFDVPKGSPDLADRVGGLAARIAGIESIVLDAMFHRGARETE